MANATVLPVAAYLAYVFEKMSVPAMLHEGAGALDHRHALRAGDALLAITFAPYSAETLALASEAHARGLPVVRGGRAVEVPFFTELDDPSFDPEAALERAVTDRTVATSCSGRARIPEPPAHLCSGPSMTPRGKDRAGATRM